MSVKMVEVKSPDPKHDVIVVPQFEGPAMTGNGEFDHQCPTCVLTLIKGCDDRQGRNFIFRCGRCGTYCTPQS